jgi:glycosyltransferase involved in cell wall biosynthesis
VTGLLRHAVFLTDELEIGGSQRQILELAKGLRERGVRASVVYFRGERADMLPHFAAAGIEPIVVRKRRALDPPFLLRLLRTLRRLRADVLQTYGPTADLWGRLAALAARPPVVISSARGIHVLQERRRLLRPLDRFTTAFLANSQEVRRRLHEARGIPLDRIGVIYNGQRVPPRAPRSRPADGPGVAGTACRLVPEKNLACLLQASARLRAAGFDHRIEVAGEGPLRGRLEEEARALGVAGAVRFLGPRGDVPALLAGWDVAVLPSLYEGLSNFVMEAMAAGVPVVASDIPSNRELVEEGRSGLLFPPDSPQALADALASLLGDALRARGLAEEAARQIRRFSVESMVDQHLALYERCLRDGSVRPAPAPCLPPPA